MIRINLSDVKEKRLHRLFFRFYGLFSFPLDQVAVTDWEDAVHYLNEELNSVINEIEWTFYFSIPTYRAQKYLESKRRENGLSDRYPGTH